MILGARSALLVGLLSAAAGCHTDDTTLPDALGDDAGRTGLSVSWQSRPSIPSRVDGGVSIERAVFRVRSLRAVGDAGIVDLPSAALEWARDLEPAPREADNAPPGLYSRLLFELDPGAEQYAYEITGTAEVGGVEYPFVIRDRSASAMSLDFSILLPPGGDAMIPVRVEVEDLVEAVRFDQVPVENGALIVEDGAQLTEVRDELRGAFGVHSALR